MKPHGHALRFNRHLLQSIRRAAAFQYGKQQIRERSDPIMKHLIINADDFGLSPGVN
ncbi:MULTISPECIES: hypothetical protein [Paenibacillus]|uniref:hypothetical protein n=1 Tax=Paenibacillus TaxID=44249 RepID=UPI001B36C87F|nr:MULTISPECIES: hypothetical protein [Paenibacillus]MBQ4901196.1 hypothetical protein [Paenibacillus sp. Marseille-P2973]